MSESEGEQAARSVALEQAYVHEVYEQCAERSAQCRHHWPRIYQFLEELEPGALVCDIGCGNGKYLNVNHNVFKVGVDRCRRFADIAREKENEVLICDNLALPFRDESFDAVLSIAVVHHFATTERRVHALKELARVLRIGGRLVISVWAMEQRHRKFESQDVLVPWPKAYCTNASSDDLKSPCAAIPCDRYRNHCAQKYLSSKRGSHQKGKSRGYWIDPILSPSPSTSSLSSPNETCYSFFRRALQKLAGGKRGSSGRPWFLDGWQTSGTGGKHRRRRRRCAANGRNASASAAGGAEDGEDREDEDDEEEEDDDDVQDGDDHVDELPIELRQLEDVHFGLTSSSASGRHGADSLSVKSRSVGDILEIQRYDIVRSRSSIPGLCSALTSVSNLTDQSKASSVSGSKPRLVKQKTHLVDDLALEMPDNTATPTREDPPDAQATPTRRTRKGIVPKQCSLNEELMSVERLEEKERLRRNIMKQASLNEEIICKRNTFESFKDSIYSGNATKKFQLLKSGLTNKIKQSTTNIEKVSSMSIKNGFVRILQSWKSTENDVTFDPSDSANDPSSKSSDKSQPTTTTTATTTTTTTTSAATTTSTSSASGTRRETETIERRASREDGSDSSKDSSLQSDTSVDSEDSIASVIYVPQRQDVVVLGGGGVVVEPITAPLTTGYRHHLGTMSAPPSPRVKHPPDLTAGAARQSRLVTISPLIKQFPATSKSLPPPSPPGLSPRTFGSLAARTFFGNGASQQQQQQTEIRNNTSVERKASVAINDGIANGEKVLAAGRSNVEKVANGSEKSNGESTGPKTENVATKNGHTTSVETKEEKSSAKCETKVAPTNLISLPSSTKIGTLEDYSKSLLAGRRPIRAGTPTSNDEEVVVVASRDSSSSSATEETSPLIDEPDRGSGKSSSSSSSTTSTREKSGVELLDEDESRLARLNQIKELLKQKPGFATRTKTSYPIVRRASTAASGRLETVTRVLPRLLSLELFNPETDDLDSDSSGVSSPESVGSVISVISDERYTMKKDAAKTEASTTVDNSTNKSDKPASNDAPETTTKNAAVETTSTTSATTATSSRLIEAAANVASSLESAVGRAIQQRTSGDSRIVQRQSSLLESSPRPAARNLSATRHRSLDERGETTWNEQCRKHLNDFTEKLGENLIHDIDQYCRRARREFAEDAMAMESEKAMILASAERTGREAAAATPRNARKIAEFANTIAWLNSSNPENAEKPVTESFESDSWPADLTTTTTTTTTRVDETQNRAGSDDETMGFVVVSRSGEFADAKDVATHLPSTTDEKTRSRNSIESSDIGDSIENTISLSSGSTGTDVAGGLGSTASLRSNCEQRERRRLRAETRSASEETGNAKKIDKDPINATTSTTKPTTTRTTTTTTTTTTASNAGTLSGSSSQESLPSERGGGAITYHQYYHVFREGELDQLIDKYVENLHIIASYYDHASWCIVAEKVQVWTI